MVAASESQGAATYGPSPFHKGEQEVQDLTGARNISEQLGRAWHRKEILPASASFFARQQLLYTATRSRDQRLWASVFVGPEGFASAASSKTFQIHPIRQFRGDQAEFNKGEHIGTTGIILETRQRERLNGVVESVDKGCLSITVQQSFGSCPKYIQARKVEVLEEELHRIGIVGEVAEGLDELEGPQRQQIAKSDTMFLATCFFGKIDSQGDGVQGTDISHRGGPPGFVSVSGPGTLRFADYVGNYTFTTLGNLYLDPRASLLFVDYTNGDVLQLSGHCKVLWAEKELPGAQRTIEFVTEKWVHSRRALPLRAPGAVRWSPYNPLPTWQFSKEVGEDRLNQLQSEYVEGNTAVTMLRCLAVRRESKDVITFALEAKDKRTPPAANLFCDPGQYASFDFPDIREGETLNRTWTISSPQSQIRDDQAVTITVKKVGLVSSWLHENLQVGRTVCCRGVDGDFTLARFLKQPPVGFLFVAGGIGITPLRAMFHESIEKGIPATLLYSVRALDDAVFWQELQEAAAGSEAAEVFLTITGQEKGSISAPADTNLLTGRVSATMLTQVCSNIQERAILQCGPLKMMAAVSADLKSLGVPHENIHKEDFDF